MYRPIVLTLAWAIAGSTARADSPLNPTEAAARAWSITDAVLARHVEPPARQQMFLAGLEALAKADHYPRPAHLARRVSDLSEPGQLARLLAEIQASPKVEVARTATGDGPGRALPDDRTPDEAFFEGLLSILPGGGTLMTEKERKVQESFGANLYVGIQVALGRDDKAGKPVFQQVFEDGPAGIAGVKAGDLIEEIDGVSAQGMPLARVVDRLRGEEGTDVLVKFRRPETGEVFTKAMTRGRLPRATVEGLGPLPGKRWTVRLEGPLPIGYLKITEVSGSTPSELRAFAEQLESEGAKALVLDLRKAGDSRAGLHPIVLLADLLLDGGVIGRVESAEEERTIRAEPDALFRDWPMVVLAGDVTRNPGVAWLCAALRDNHRATVLGNVAADDDPLVQEMVTLPGGDWTVQMATGRLLRGDGQPLKEAYSRIGTRPEASPSRIMKKAPNTSGTYAPAPTSSDADPRPDASKVPERDPLVKARELLEDALKSPRK